ncbi:MAG TPA: hypothetical protein VGO14_04030 [Solirubrobacteraceae bacterium]|jgi:hypothetical protein|nr:hypothetical protein [Solirubrobacteraceae bacterium]
MADDLERVLKRLQHGARERAPAHDAIDAHSFFQAPNPDGGSVTVALFNDGYWAFEEVCDRLVDDLRFEYMEANDRQAAAQAFAAAAAVQGSEDHVAAFIDQHAKPILETTCSFTVEHLKIDQPREMFGARFLPGGEARVLPYRADDALPVDAVIEVPCRGTHGVRMMERAKDTAEHALRLLRAGLRDQGGPSDDYLRFRLGVQYWFTLEDQTRPGWKRRPGEPLTLPVLTDELVKLATSSEVATLPQHASADVEQRANRALVWWERSFLATDAIEKVVFLFTALESILGDKDGGLKAERLSMRRAALSESLGRGFTLPERSLALYEQVRSKAIHGEKPAAVSLDQALTFERDVRHAIDEYLLYARERDFTRRKDVRDSLVAKQREIVDFLTGANADDTTRDEGG